jgi:hypothetical protein
MTVREHDISDAVGLHDGLHGWIHGWTQSSSGLQSRLEDKLTVYNSYISKSD